MANYLIDLLRAMQEAGLQGEELGALLEAFTLECEDSGTPHEGRFPSYVDDQLAEWADIKATIGIGTKLAVSGTLRRGQALSGWFNHSPDFDYSHHIATIDGSLYHHPGGYEYPVTVLNTGEETVVEIVEVLTLQGAERMRECLQMEEDAGYRIDRVIAKTRFEAETEVQVLTCHWLHTSLGSQVADNDWSNYTEAN